MDISPINTTFELNKLFNRPVQKDKSALGRQKRNGTLMHGVCKKYIGKTQFQIFQGQLEDDNWTAP
jgi:hypothetical protein